MPEYLPVTVASSRSVALRFEPDTDLLAGSFLRLLTSPDASATARSIEGTEPTSASATAPAVVVVVVTSVTITIHIACHY